MLHKAFLFLMLPLGAALLSLLVALRWNYRTLIAVPFLLLLIFSIPAIADRLLGSLENQYPYRSDAQCPQADAVFALGGILGGSGRPSASFGKWHGSGERFERALDLYTSGHTRTLAFSEAHREGARLKQIAVARGVSAQTIMVIPGTTDTASEADGLCAVASRLHWKTVLLVTSAFHMPRAMRLFHGCSAEIVPVPVDYKTPEPKQDSGTPDSESSYLPNAEALGHSERALHEYFSILFYSVAR